MVALPFLDAEIEGALGDRFARVARDLPRRTAVLDGDRATSYAELDELSGRIAGLLLDRLGPDNVPVALLLRQGMPAIATILGILRAGKVYVPLDPLYPEARLAAILDHAGARLLLTDDTCAPLAARLGAPIIPITAAAAAAPAPRIDVAPDALAYLLYTSGSTGRPKGVPQTHRNVLYDIRRQGRDLATTLDDRYGLLFSTASSASVCHVFGALLHGAAVLPFDVRERGLPALARWLRDSDITILDINVSTFRQLCATLAPGPDFPRLRLLAPGSEPVYASDLELYRRHFAPTCVLQNALGTTETRTVTQMFFTPETPVDGALVPVGWDFPEKRVLLLDDDGHEVAPGESGEIAVRSRYLSPGYWRDPAATAAAFRPAADGERIYLTGDLGRRRADGCLIHLGRKDFQVKIRGHRVELAEVETALLGHPAVAQAAAAAVPDGHGSNRLVAYVVPREGATPSPAELGRHLRALLPPAMWPSQLVSLRALPQTDNGKLDRRAMPPPPPRVAPGAGPPPSRPAEEAVARIFAELLDVTGLGGDDDFFALGGNSLLAVRACAALGVPPSALGEAPTVRALAALVEALPRGARLVGLQPRGRRPPLFCVHGVDGSALAFKQLAQHLGDDQPLHAFEADGRAQPLERIEDLAALYRDCLRARFPRGPYRIVGYSLGGLVALELARLLLAGGEHVELLGLLDTAVTEEPPPLVDRAARSVARLRAIGRERGLRAAAREAWLNVAWSARHRLVPARTVIDANLRARAAYRPRPYPGRVTLFRACLPGEPTPTAGWRAIARGGLVVHDVAANHDLLFEPYVQGLAAALARVLK